jgi:hypothetical protein
MAIESARVWVLDGKDESIQRLIESVSASHHRLEAVARQIVETGHVRTTRLPGWTNAHLLCHLERNAASHVPMLEATLKGNLVDQYPGGASGRRAEIDSGSHRPLGVLASAFDLRTSAYGPDGVKWSSTPSTLTRTSRSWIGPPILRPPDSTSRFGDSSFVPSKTDYRVAFTVNYATRESVHGGAAKRSPPT